MTRLRWRAAGLTLAAVATLWACDDDSTDGGDPAMDAAAAADGTAPAPDGALAPDAGPAPDDGVIPDAGPAPDQGMVACDPGAVLEAKGCAAGGCHSPPVAGGLDLVAPDLATRLVGAPSTTPGCEGRLVIDPQRPERSVMLTAVGAAPPVGDACQVVMPPQGSLSAAEQACLTAWVDGLIDEAGPIEPVDPFEPTPATAALAKVKTLLTGLAPTAEELAAVQADPGALRGLIEGWSDRPEFQRKLADFLLVALQQRLQLLDVQQFDRLQGPRLRSPLLRQVLEESFVRTALDLVARGRPFTEILTTRTWMVTTANLVLLRYPDQPTNAKRQRHTVVGDAAEAPASLAEQVAQRTWHIPAAEGLTCNLSQVDVLDMFFGAINQRRCRPAPPRNLTFVDAPLTDADFQDWRMVEMVPLDEAQRGEAPIPFYDLPRLREADRMVTTLPRVGFFTTSVFLNNWATNPDNQFRVNTNQLVLGALHAGFTASEPTEPLHTDGLDDAHSAPDTACYGCHRQIDPMRLYFTEFGFNTQQRAAQGPEVQVFDPEDQPGFAFLGVTAEGGDLLDLAQTLAAHPRFPIAWTQKLCLYANASRCDEADPAFQAIAARFADGFDFQGLVVDLFSSPLVTGLSETETWAGAELPVGITRRNHLCALLDARLGTQGLCANRRVASVVGLIPVDDFARGEADFTQPNRPSAFQFAAAEAVCEAVSSVVVTGAGELFPVRDVPAAIQAIVSRLMGLPAGHPRYEPMVAALTAHQEAAAAAGLNPAQAMRAVFTLACLSPDVQGVGL